MSQALDLGPGEELRAEPALELRATADTSAGRRGRDLVIDIGVCLLATGAGLGLLVADRADGSPSLAGVRAALEVGCGALACGALGWRRRWPSAVAVGCSLLGMVSISATPAGLISLFSLAVHRPLRPVMAAALLWLPSLLVFGLYSPAADPLSVVLVMAPQVLAVTALGMFVRARRQLLLSLRERAERAEADQRLREETTRRAERTRIAREMHDVLAHRISLMALHAGGLEVRPDLPPQQVRETAVLLRSTARLALEELRGVIGVLREDPDAVQPPTLPQPRLADIRRLVEQTRQAGTVVDLDLRVDDEDAVPPGLGRDAYRIVQEALTNIGKHAAGTPARVRVAGAAGHGLRISVRNRTLVPHPAEPSLPGSGTGLLGLQERVALSSGTLLHGPDESGDFVVEAELPW